MASASGVVTFTDAIGVALITARLIKGGDDPRWYVRHGWIVGAGVFYLGRVAEDYLLAKAAQQIADANGGVLPPGYELFAPYLPASYTGIAKPSATPAAPALPKVGGAT